MPNQYHLIVIGGGPAGCTAAIAAARAAPQSRILLLEAGRYPRHKVCGEFISAEGVEALVELTPAHAAGLLQDRPHITRARLFFERHALSAGITPPAASITRYDLDFGLWRLAESLGIECRQQSAVHGVSPCGNEWQINVPAMSCRLQARALVNATGRWSRLTPRETAKHLSLSEKAKWIGLKGHFREDSPSPASPLSVDLYFFAGGYCGVQPIAPGQVNACAMVRAAAAATLEDVLALHPELRARSRDWQPASTQVSTAPLLFRKPAPVVQGILHAGDASGFIDPFVGDGITLALRSGALAGGSLAPFLRDEISLAQATRNYAQQYQRSLAPSFRRASHLRRLLHLPSLLRRPLIGAIGLTHTAELLVRGTRIAS